MKNDDLRYSRLSDILQVVFLMRGKRQGLTLDEIAEEIHATRRTAERVRDAILRNFPHTNELPSDDNYKRWGFVNCTIKTLSGYVGFSDEEILELEHLKKQAAKKGDGLREELLGAIINKIMVLKLEAKNSENVDVENLKLLIQSEGYAVSQFSRQVVNIQLLETIREGLKAHRLLAFTYTKREGETSQREVEPYGVLYHHKNYLVAKDEGIIKLFDVSRIENISVDGHFSPDESFNLQEFAERSFGVYQEEPIEVVLLFNQYSREDAISYHFHPSQVFTPKENGELEVRFKAGGVKSIIWELFKWGTGVQILEPQSLKDAYTKELQAILKKYS